MSITAEALQAGWMGRMSQRMRAQRFARFAALAENLPKPLRILDVGGRNAFWEHYGWAGRTDVHITLANIEHQAKVHTNIDPLLVNATHMEPFADKSFDIVFSNSVIEHLRTWENQQAMAREVRRVGKAYWVQTPNYWFPMEPHFRVLGWQWLPIWARVALLQRRDCGWRGRTEDKGAALKLVGEVRLLTRSQLRRLFPDADLWPERVIGLAKSLVAYHGLARS